MLPGACSFPLHFLARKMLEILANSSPQSLAQAHRVVRAPVEGGRRVAVCVLCVREPLAVKVCAVLHVVACGLAVVGASLHIRERIQNCSALCSAGPERHKDICAVLTCICHGSVSGVSAGMETASMAVCERRRHKQVSRTPRLRDTHGRAPASGPLCSCSPTRARPRATRDSRESLRNETHRGRGQACGAHSHLCHCQKSKHPSPL
jgi:hypothetical protein